MKGGWVGLHGRREWAVWPVHLPHIKGTPLQSGDHEGPPFLTQLRLPLRIIWPPAYLHGFG